MKLLSIVIPSYNTEKYLKRCLDSILYDKDIIDFLDVLIVNDGSQDKTLEIAKAYAKEYPKAVAIIDKENGGHGSTVNAGFKKAKGKYFRVIDSDDWVNIDDFADYVRALDGVESDIVITNYQHDFLYDATTLGHDFTTRGLEQFDIGTIIDEIEDEDFFFKFSMHSMSVKTEALRKVWGDGLLEKTFYVDQVYVAKALECAKTYQSLDYNIYRYFIGRPEQSVNAGGYFKHRLDHERVLRWLLKKSSDEKNEEYLAKTLEKQIKLMLVTHYEIYYNTPSASSAEIADLFKFDEFLGQNYSEYIDNDRIKHIKSRLTPPIRLARRILKGGTK